MLELCMNDAYGDLTWPALVCEKTLFFTYRSDAQPLLSCLENEFKNKKSTLPGIFTMGPGYP